MAGTRLAIELGRLEAILLDFGAMVDRQVVRAVSAVRDADLPLAQAVIRDDGELNRARFHIDNVCLSLLALHGPHAGDLRLIVAAMHVAADLERAGDHAEGIARIAVLLGERPRPVPLDDLEEMARRARTMLADALTAFADRDVVGATAVIDADDEVDALHDRVYRVLIDAMIATPDAVEPCTWLLWASHNLERIADRSTNVAERVVFLVTGQPPPMRVSSF